MGIDKSIERRLLLLEKKFPPRKLDLRGVPLEDLVALENALAPGGISNGSKPKLARRLARLMTKLESDAQ